MKMFAKMCGMAGLLCTLSGATAMAQTPNGVYLRNLSYAGTGCPAGSITNNFSEDKQAFTFILDSMSAEVGPGLSPTEARKNCQLSIDLSYPNGWSYAVFTAEYHGYLYLTSDASAYITSSIYFQGDLHQTNLRTSFQGPKNQSINIRDNLAVSSVVWSPCGAQRSLNVNLQARVQGGTPSAQGLLSLYEPVLGSLATFGIVWRRC